MKNILVVVFASMCCVSCVAQEPLNSPMAFMEAHTKSNLTRTFINPQRILLKAGQIANSEALLNKGIGQADLANRDVCVLKNTSSGEKAGILIDFGRELHGGVEIVTGMWKENKPLKVRVRFGESASEAMSDIGEKGATNDHAIRDFTTLLPWLGKIQLGESGFRFVRIDLEEEDAELQLKEVSAIFTYRDIPYLGSFKSSDDRLNQIWETGAYTVHLNMQEYLWDGIKRDRLVWVGDMHPEVATINSVFGFNEVVPKSLDLSREITPLPDWMNGISTYSMWWIIIQRDWYMHHGDLNYLKKQQPYLAQLLRHLVAKIDGNKESLDGNRFLDWPSSENKAGIHAGLQAMMVLSLQTGVELSEILEDTATAAICKEAVAKLKQYTPNPNQSKQAAALMALADLMPAAQANKEVLGVDGAKDFSTFYGYYMLQAMAKAGDYQAALNNIRTYWGAMLDLGATTFWEDFNLEWLPNASRIDELVPPGKKDIHGDYGAYCYEGFRHSLCHGWASGPTAWLTEHILGIKVTAPGCKEIKITPHLEDLEFAEGTFPTPEGLVWVKHTKQADGKIKTAVKAPKGIKIIQ
ncbi:alpha-L-rhamnosidase [Olivibacter sp. SDN3]|uniref:alpha-L-rhamnosidase-related protein n=1 Tax=Olivibacter sp. SDN3 TaxID=2764720 RepID=UPI001650E0BD|nr:alpha-L-rhamnosidase C-terminal domain-containing protein [Olivibacter sp. SDN3]QNL50446.1 alpha-L-rhamnosidase [Olivibacter sp. SDN3]